MLVSVQMKGRTRCEIWHVSRLHRSQTEPLTRDKKPEARWAHIMKLITGQKAAEKQAWPVEGGLGAISRLPVNIPTWIWWSWLVKIIPSDAMFPRVLTLTDTSTGSRTRAQRASNWVHAQSRLTRPEQTSDKWLEQKEIQIALHLILMRGSQAWDQSHLTGFRVLTVHSTPGST